MYPDKLESYLVWGFVQNERHYGMGGRRNASTDGIFVARWATLHQGIHLLLHGKVDSQHLKGHQSYSLPVFPVLFLLKQLFYQAIWCQALLTEIWKEPSLSHLLNNHFSYHPNHTKTGSNKPRFLNAQNQQLESDLSKENDLPHKICKKTT